MSDESTFAATSGGLPILSVAASNIVIMTPTNVTRLERLFDRYSSDLERFDDRLRGKFGCPLCYRIFSKSGDLRETLAVEHLLPSALGSSPTTLTCRQCNNDDGRDLDAHLVQRVRLEAQKRPILARVKVKDAEQGAAIILPRESGDPFKIVGIPKQSDPRRVQEIMASLDTGATEIKMQLNFGYNHQRSLVALIRAAYLMMFRTFGYRYVLDASAKPIQYQVKHPLEQTAVLNGIMWKVPDTVPNPSFLAVMAEPADLQSFVALLTLDRDSEHVAAVALPPPGSDGAKLYPAFLLPEAAGRKTLVKLPATDRGFLPLKAVWDHIPGQSDS